MKKTLFSAIISAMLLPTISFSATIATVNGVKVDDKLIQQSLSQIPAEILKVRKDEIIKSLTDKLVEQEILKQAAVKAKIQQSDEYKEQLKSIKTTLAANLLIKKIVADAVNEKTIKQAFEDNKASFASPAVKARHILVKTEKEAKDIIKQLNKGADFIKLAKEKSVGPSAKNGGDLGWFTEKDMVKPFADVAFTLAKNNYSKTPVKTQFGWHVILVTDKNPKKTPEFNLVKGQIAQQLQEKTVTEYLTKLKSEAKVEYTK